MAEAWLRMAAVRTLVVFHDGSLPQCSVFFFFQAEDGIRDLTVTGVQTCALPISVALAPPWGASIMDMPTRLPLPSKITIEVLPPIDLAERFGPRPDHDEVYEEVKIGRASCRERV